MGQAKDVSTVMEVALNKQIMPGPHPLHADVGGTRHSVVTGPCPCL